MFVFVLCGALLLLSDLSLYFLWHLGMYRKISFESGACGLTTLRWVVYYLLIIITLVLLILCFSSYLPLALTTLFISSYKLFMFPDIITVSSAYLMLLIHYWSYGFSSASRKIQSQSIYWNVGARTHSCWGLLSAESDYSFFNLLAPRSLVFLLQSGTSNIADFLQHSFLYQKLSRVLRLLLWETSDVNFCFAINLGSRKSIS